MQKLSAKVNLTRTNPTTGPSTDEATSMNEFEEEGPILGEDAMRRLFGEDPLDSETDQSSPDVDTTDRTEISKQLFLRPRDSTV